MRILIVMGTRPEAIKMAPIVAAFSEKDGHTVRLSLTAQHRSMLDDVLRVFDLRPDDDLNLMRPGQSLTDLTTAILHSIGKVMDEFAPDWVIVQGDTTTAFATSLAAFYRRIRVAHVEAGLRTGRLYDPWPEEGNRKLISNLATRHYAPTQSARANLLRENVSDEAIAVVGNSVIDALKTTAARFDHDTELAAKMQQSFEWLVPGRRMILVTGHRRETFGPGFEGICAALASLAKRDDVQIVYPVHLNPNVRKDVHGRLAGLDNIFLLEPIDYLSFVYLMKRCHLILTDSGGIQEEAPSLGKPVLIMRNTTERLEAVEANVARLVTTDPQKIVESSALLLDDDLTYMAMSRATDVFGDGKTASRIVEDIFSQV